MFTSIEGTYRNGKVELTETPIDIPDQTQVIVTTKHGQRLILPVFVLVAAPSAP